jgi:hypothetical protein
VGDSGSRASAALPSRSESLGAQGLTRITNFQPGWLAKQKIGQYYLADFLRNAFEPVYPRGG